MPLLRHAPFRRKKIPKNLDPNAPLYYLELTEEVFTEYEEFCYRTIQCNSLVWTCAETGRTELTFSEALESERDAKQILNCFPEELKVPALYLASIAQCPDFQELVSDVLNFMEKHYFVNELVVPIPKYKWKLGTILKVKNPKGASLQSTQSKSAKKLQHYTPPAWYEYEIATNIDGEEMHTILTGSKLKRPDDTCLTRDTLSAFLKQNAVLDSRRIWVIKGSVLQQYNIQFVKFDDIFCGDPPVFPGSSRRKPKNKCLNKHIVNSSENKPEHKTPKVTKSNKGNVTTSERRKIRNVHPRTNEHKVNSKPEGRGKQTGQQNIQKYFFSSKRPAPQSNKDEIESDEDNLNDVEREIKSEPCSPASVLEICSDEETGSSGDEIKVVWASTVKPNIHAMNKLFNKMGKVVVDLGQGPIEIKQEPENSLESSSVEENEKDRSRKKGSLTKKQLSSVANDAQNGLISPGKKLKQTRMFEIEPSTYTDKHKRPSFNASYKKGEKGDNARGRKQKIVGTLKPWVKTTQKDGDSSVAASSSMKKAPTSGTSQTLKEKKKNWLEVQREIELREKEKKQEERRRKKAKLEEEKLRFAKFMKEWRKRREDLLCEDLKPLPVPCEINYRIPNQLFGDFMMVLEFLHSFSPVLKTKIHGGITFEFLEKALVETEIAGPLNDVVKSLLTTIFDLQVIEHEKPKSGVPIAVDLNLDDLYDDVPPQEAVSHSITATGWCDVFQGISLHDIPITSNTVSEILRLHLLGSGGRAWDTTSKWLSYRGGYTNLDDPGLWLRLEKPSILLNLSHNHISELPIVEKLEILCCLVNQVLTYATVRDKVEERCEQARQAKASVRSLQVAEIKLQKEATAKRIQEKKDAKLSLAKGSSQVSADMALCEKLRMEKEINKLKVDLQKKSTKVLPLAMSGQLLPLGCDRAHRKYWLFSSLPGLFVEYNPFEIGPCLPQPTPRALELSDTLTHVRRLFEEEGHNSSDKENDSSDRDVLKPQSTSVKKMLGEQNNTVETLNVSRQNQKEDTITDTENVPEGELLLCTASDSCPVHCPPVSTSHWRFFAKGDDVSALIGSLNDRGIRESALLLVLKQEEQRIVESVSQCPVHKLNPGKFQFAECEQRKSTRHNSGYKFESVKSKFPPDTPVSYIMEWTIRECILELENRITIGRVGSLKVTDRMAWRKAIENGQYDKQCEKLVWGFRMRNKKQDQEIEERTETEEENVESSEQDKENETENDNEKVEDVIEEEEEESMQIAEQVEENEEMETKQSGQDTGEEMMSEDDHSCSQSSDESAILVYEGPTTTQIARKTMINEERMDESKEKNQKNSQALEQDSDTFEIIDQDQEDECDLDDESSFSEDNESKSLDKEDTAEGISTSTNVPPPRNPVIKDLASAILQIGQCLDPRCLQKPLADERGKMNSRMKYWEVSLMNTINFSQLFIHHTTLENSINWVSSVYNSPCFYCDKRNYPRKMILCDGCHKRFHIYCAKPKLKCLPEGHWLCQYCSPEESESILEENVNNSNVSTRSTAAAERKRKAVSDNVDDDEDSNGDNSDEHHFKIRKDKYDTCKKCAQTGELVYCTTCAMGYHSECISSSRLRRQQKENWLCESCKSEVQINLSDDEEFQDEIVDSAAEEPGDDSPEDSSDESSIETSGESSDEADNESRKKPMNKRPNKSIDQSPVGQISLEYDEIITSSRERRGCASAARAKIASFTKRLRKNSWDDDNDVPRISTIEDSMLSNIQDNSSVRRSSRRSLLASEDLPLDNAILQDLMTEMIQHENAWPFLRPVRKSQVPDYHTKIKRPMDLGTIKYKLNTAEYKMNEDFLKDIFLVFENCFMYNDKNTIEHYCGTKMLLFFKQRCRELGFKWKGHEYATE